MTYPNNRFRRNQANPGPPNGASMYAPHYRAYIEAGRVPKRSAARLNRAPRIARASLAAGRPARSATHCHTQS
ncbi:MAG: hypothetical protein NVS4B8_24210 [Herpetosiphon sp.]